ncbi:MAG: glycosyltransferase family 2 protein [Anaerolinea sp.]|nr:glycosyltransferase family 2 protein [Anaerolinea sp.]
MDISVVIPLLNEEDNLALLHERLTAVFATLDYTYEIIYVDDGSTDNSLKILQGLLQTDPDHVKIVELQRNFGKTTAMVAAFQNASGEVVITMDADLQDDPNEIPGMLEAINAGNDLVVAWRKERMDKAKKKLSSRIFNKTVSRLAGIPLHDFNCGFKAYRHTVIKSIRLYSDLHRFTPVLAAWNGFRVTERPVVHHPRHAGVSKYGTGRVLRGFMDLIMVLFITRFLRQPLRLFGWLGVTVFSFGALLNGYFALLWLSRFLGLAAVEPIGTRPLFSVGILSLILGIQLISIGLLGEMIRYFTYRPSDEYVIRKVWIK